MTSFFVAGLPVPKGSMKAFFVKKLGRSVIVNDNARTKPWAKTITDVASTLDATKLAGDVCVMATFLLPRPKGHFGARGLLPSAPRRPTKKPDVDKLLRTLLDALTGVLWIDDAQVTDVLAKKRFVEDGQTPGVLIEIDGAQ